MTSSVIRSATHKNEINGVLRLYENASVSLALGGTHVATCCRRRFAESIFIDDMMMKMILKAEESIFTTDDRVTYYVVCEQLYNSSFECCQCIVNVEIQTNRCRSQE